MNHFHNSTNEQEKLPQYEQSAKTQDELIFNHLKSNPSKAFTASDLWFHTGLDDKGVPITSIRRSLTNLTTQGKARKTTDKKIGLFGRPEYFFTLGAGFPNTFQLPPFEVELPPMNREQLLKTMQEVTPKLIHPYKLF